MSPGGTSPPVWMCIYWQRVVFNNMVLYGYTCVQNTVIYVQSRLWLHGYPPIELNHCKMIWTFNFYLINATFRSPVLIHSSQDSIQIRKTGCILSAAGLNSKSFPATTLKLNHEAKLPKDVLQALRSGLALSFTHLPFFTQLLIFLQHQPFFRKFRVNQNKPPNLTSITLKW